MIGKKRIRHFFTLAFNKYAESEEVPKFLLILHYSCGLILAAFMVCPIKVAKEIDVIPS